VHTTTNRSNILKEKARRLHTRQRRDLQIAASDRTKEMNGISTREEWKL
jgi:hypothetical protein